MATATIFWNGGLGFDTHVMKGEKSQSLLDLLVIEQDNGDRDFARNRPADVDSITFEPNFASTTTPPSNSGVTVDISTGEVTVDDPLPPPPRLQSFVIEARVTTNSSPPKTFGPIPIRVHVHDSINELWLTPARLTVHRGTQGTRFTVLAQFDNLTIGDITNRPGITWAESDPRDPTRPRITVGKSGASVGELLATDRADSSTSVTITATHAGKSNSATAEGKEPWSTPVEATLLTSRSAGLAKMADVPNVLFVPDGFGSDPMDRPAFEDLVSNIVDVLQKKDSPLRPFDLVKGAVNYWMAFVPSRDRGASVLYDMNLEHRTTLRGDEITDPVKPTPGTSFSVANLIYEVGLPTPGDATASALGKRGEWLLMYGADVSLGFTNAVFDEWKKLHDHRLANEKDTAFGISLGQRPTMHKPAPGRLPDFHPLRRKPAHPAESAPAFLEEFLRNIFCRTKSGTPMIGTIWATPSKPPDPPVVAPSHPDLPTGLKVGQDHGSIFFLLAGTRYGGNTSDDGVFISLRSEVDVEVVAGLPQLNVVPYDVPKTPQMDAVATVAHETGHRFGLGDEYGEFEEPLTIPASDAASLSLKGNVQAASDLAKSATDPTIDPAKINKIKWLWPRIDAAGALVTEPEPGPPYRIRLEPGHAADFAPGDIVRLRKRPLVANPLPSIRLKVIEGGVDFVADAVTVRPVDPATSITPAEWPAGSVLIRPNPNDLLLVAPIIRRYLVDAGIPINRTPSPTPPPPSCVKDDTFIQIPPKALRDGLMRPRYKAQVVGLFDGGARFYCGVYHPSGACLMRKQSTPPPPTAKGKPATPTRTYLFCPVCRYLIVDRFAPTKHRLIDKDYAKRYAQGVP